MDELVRAQDRIGKFNTIFSLKNGKEAGRVVGVNKRRLNEGPFFLNTDPPRNSVTVPANQTSNAQDMKVSGEGPVQLTQIGAVQNDTHGAVLVRLYMRDGSQSTQISNVPLHINTIAGPGGQMYPLPEGLYIDESRAMVSVFTDLTGDETHARITVVGAKYSKLREDPSLQRVKERLKASEFLSTPQFYGLNDGAVTLTPYQTQQFQIEISDQHNFEIHQMSKVSTGDFLINIVDLAKDESLINAPRNSNYPMPASLIIGDGSYPYRFHEPPLVFGGGRLLITLVDTSGSSNTIYFTMGGVALKVRQWS
jgi:hypothetical protein